MAGWLGRRGIIPASVNLKSVAIKTPKVDTQLEAFLMNRMLPLLLPARATRLSCNGCMEPVHSLLSIWYFILLFLIDWDKRARHEVAEDNGNPCMPWRVGRGAVILVV